MGNSQSFIIDIRYGLILIVLLEIMYDYCTVVQTNTKAVELYKRYGFVEEGLLIKDRIHKDGNYYNTVIMGKLFDNQIFPTKI